jgi:hypothetical protein
MENTGLIYNSGTYGKLFTSKVEKVYSGFLKSLSLSKSVKFPNYSTYIFRDSFGKWVDRSRKKGYNIINESFSISFNSFLDISELGYVKLRSVIVKNSLKIEILFQVYDSKKLVGRLQIYLYYYEDGSEKTKISEILEVSYDEWFKVEVYVASDCYMAETSGASLKYILKTRIKTQKNSTELTYRFIRNLGAFYELKKLFGFDDYIKVKNLELSEKAGNPIYVKHGSGDYSDIRAMFI